MTVAANGPTLQPSNIKWGRTASTAAPRHKEAAPPMHDECRTLPGLLASAAEVRAYERAAEAIVLAEAACAESGCPLSERQRIDIIASSLQCFDGLASELEGAGEVVAFIGALLPGERVVNGERVYSAAFLGERL